MAKANTTSKSGGRGTKSGGSGAKKSAKKTAKSGSGSGGAVAAGGGSSKKTAKKPAAKKTTKKAVAKKAAASGAVKKSASKTGSKKAGAKKTASKAGGSTAGGSKKSAAKKAPAAGSKKAASKASEKKATTKKAGGAAETKAPAEKASADKAGGKSGGGSKKSKAAEPKADAGKGEAGKVGDAKADASGDDKKPNRKGITIVSKKPSKKKGASKPTPKFPPTSGMLLGPGSPVRRPLIPSGPSAAPPEGDGLDTASKGKKKSPFNKRELDKFRRILLVKRAELIGDVSAIEAEALLGSAGDLSSLPQHLAEQGSDSYERSLSLDLAAADRRLIKEIDEALQRIDEGVYGLCEQTGKPIRKARLEELPWARYSIEAARAMERSGHPG